MSMEYILLATRSAKRAETDNASVEASVKRKQ